MGWQELQRKWEARPEYAEALEEELPYREVAAAVVAFRVSRGLTQRQLADLAGTTQSVISRLESGRHSVEIALLSRVATALGASWRPLFETPLVQQVPAVAQPRAAFLDVTTASIAYQMQLKPNWPDKDARFFSVKGRPSDTLLSRRAAKPIDELDDQQSALALSA